MLQQIPLRLILTTGFFAIMQVSCATVVRTHILAPIKSENAPAYPTQIEVFQSPRDVPHDYNIVGQVEISDTGFSIDCDFNSMVRKIQHQALIAGADAAFLTQIEPPSFRSTCYQGSANLIVYGNSGAAKDAQKGVVKGDTKTGSGFLISQEGLIATNFHVIEQKKTIHVYFDGLKDGISAKVIAADAQNDIAILKVTDAKWKKKAITYNFRTSSGVMIGEDVFTMGFPLGSILGNNIRLTLGSISSKAGILDDKRMYQITTAIQPGNSGGPLIDMNGNIVGIVVATLSPSAMLKLTGALPQNINFAIKTEYLLSLAEAHDISLPRSGRNISGLRRTSEIANQLTPFIARIVAE